MVAIADRRLTAQQSSVPAVAQTLKTGVTLPQYLRAALDATVNASASGRTLRVRTHYFVSHPVAAVLWGNIGALKFSEIEVSFNDRRLCDSTDLSFHCLYRREREENGERHKRTTIRGQSGRRDGRLACESAAVWIYSLVEINPKNAGKQGYRWSGRQEQHDRPDDVFCNPPSRNGPE
jgi:hypothetical protein